MGIAPTLLAILATITTSTPPGTTWLPGSTAGATISTAGFVAAAGNDTEFLVVQGNQAGVPGAIKSADGGATWTDVASLSADNYNSAVWTGTNWLIGGFHVFRYSPDTVSWATVTASPVSLDRWARLCVGTGSKAGIVIASGTFVGYCIRSADHGATWAQVTAPNSVLSGRFVSDGNNGFLYYRGTECWSSPDGTTGSWTLISTVANFTVTYMARDNTNAVIVQTNAAVSTTNVRKNTDSGITWVQETTDAAHGINGIIHGAGVWIAPGNDNGYILRSIDADTWTWLTTGVSHAWAFVAFCTTKGFIIVQSGGGVGSSIYYSSI